MKFNTFPHVATATSTPNLSAARSATFAPVASPSFTVFFCNINGGRMQSMTQFANNAWDADNKIAARIDRQDS